MIMVPYKSVAAALILALLLGPVGVFYSSFLGGIVMSTFGLVAAGTMKSMGSYLPLVTVILFGIIWAMISVRLYNHKMLQIAIKGHLGKCSEHKVKGAKKARLFSWRIKKLKSEGSDESAGVNEASEVEENPASWKL